MWDFSWWTSLHLFLAVVNFFLLLLLAIENRDVNGTTGDNIDLFCNAYGHPDLEYIWDVPLDDGRVIGVERDTLSIINVDLADTMDYICNVSLSGTKIGECRVTLRLQGKFMYQNSNEGIYSVILVSSQIKFIIDLCDYSTWYTWQAITKRINFPHNNLPAVKSYHICRHFF